MAAAANACLLDRQPAIMRWQLFDEFVDDGLVAPPFFSRLASTGVVENRPVLRCGEVV